MDLRTCRVHAREDGENRLAALLYLLVQDVVSFVELYQSRCSEDDHDGIDVTEMFLAVVDGDAEMFGRTCGQNINGISNR